MKTTGAKLLLVNVLLAVGAAILAPREIGTTADRVGYEFVGQHPFEPNCPYNIYCYRVLVPTLLQQLPVAHEVSWRVFAVIANAVTGLVLARIAIIAGAGFAGAFLASILFQTSFGATFSVFDPFTPDPAVYLAAALLAYCWLRRWPVRVLIVAIVGVFAKETVALVTSVVALAAWFGQRAERQRSPVIWVGAAAAAWLVLIGFHAMMDVAAGWSERGSVSADLLGGAFLARWLADATLTPAARLLYVFIPFGFAWLYAALGLRHAPGQLRALALASLVMVAVLIYVQTVERALATLSFIVIPLAALFLARVPIALGSLAALTNGLLTARVGLSSVWLPPVPYLMILAGILAAVTILRDWTGSRALSGVSIGPSVRVTSSK